MSSSPEPLGSAHSDRTLNLLETDTEDDETVWLESINIPENESSSDEETLSTCSMDTFELRNAVNTVRFNYSDIDADSSNPTLFSANHGYLRYLDGARILKKILYIVRRLAVNPTDILGNITSDYISDTSRASTVDLVRRAMDAMVVRTIRPTGASEILPPVSTIYPSSDSTENNTSPTTENSSHSDLSTPATSLSLNDGVLTGS